MKVKKFSYSKFKRKLVLLQHFIDQMDATPIQVFQRTEVLKLDFGHLVRDFEHFKNKPECQFFSILCSVSDMNTCTQAEVLLKNNSCSDFGIIKHSQNEFEGLVESFLFFGKPTLSFFGLQRLSLAIDLESYQQITKTSSFRLAEERQMKDPFESDVYQVILFPAFAIRNRMHCLIKLIMSVAGVQIVRSTFTEDLNELAFVLNQFEGNSQLSDLIHKIYSRSPCYYIVCKVFHRNLEMMQSLIRRLFNFDDSLTFETTKAILGMKASDWIPLVSNGAQKEFNKTCTLNNANQAYVFDVQNFMKSEFLGISSNSQLIDLESYKQFACHSFLAKSFGSLCLSRQVDCRHLEPMHSGRPCFVLIKPAFFRFRDCLTLFFRKLQYANKLSSFSVRGFGNGPTKLQ